MTGFVEGLSWGWDIALIILGMLVGAGLIVGAVYLLGVCAYFVAVYGDIKIRQMRSKR